MNTTKKIHVNFSSLLGLKAELLRKQTEVETARRKTDTAPAVPKLKKKNKRPKEEKTSENADGSMDVDDINTHKKSKLMLEAKSRLYEQLKQSKNNNENFLVDFANKSDESEDESLNEMEDNDTAFDDEDGWIEYKDCFGRTRKCLREDLPVMQKKDDLVKQQVMSKKMEDSWDRNTTEARSIVIEKEPEIEVMRRKWEEQMQKLTDKANIHYQDILFDEARAHGVGYYAFSQDEEERTRQQENLVQLRKETEQKQKEMKQVKELKERMEQNRLKAARIRKRIRAGLPAEPEEEELEQESKRNASDENVSAHTCDTDNPKDDFIVKDNPKNTEEDKVMIKDDKIKALGKLLGKGSHWYEMSQEEWIQKCRKARVEEFRPVYDNFKSVGYLHSASSENIGNNNSNNGIKIPKTNDDDQYHEKNKNSNKVINESSPTRTIHQPSQNTSPCIRNKRLTDTESRFQSGTPFDVEASLESVPKRFSESNTDIASGSKHTRENHGASNQTINEETITAGLRYLREKFESSQNN